MSRLTLSPRPLSRTSSRHLSPSFVHTERQPALSVRVPFPLRTCTFHHPRSPHVPACPTTPNMACAVLLSRRRSLLRSRPGLLMAGRYTTHTPHARAHLDYGVADVNQRLIPHCVCMECASCSRWSRGGVAGVGSSRRAHRERAARDAREAEERRKILPAFAWSFLFPPPPSACRSHSPASRCGPPHHGCCSAAPSPRRRACATVPCPAPRRRRLRGRA
jgi:hypothetical protein